MGNLKAFALMGVGYLLVFAAAHNGGSAALRPWQALQL